MKVFRAFGFGLAIIILLGIFGCQLNNGMFWTHNSKTGAFQTNDIGRAQKEIDFPLIFPTYVPQQLFTPPTVRGQVRGTQGNGEVEIVYNGQGMTLSIDEYSTNTTFYLAYPEQVVLNETEVQRSIQENNTTVITSYTWKQIGLSIKVEAHGITLGETEQIVISMFK